MGEPSSISPQIQSFILRTFPAARKRAINENVQILESGIVDSLGVLDIVAFLEKSFMIKISDDELTPENFASVNRLAEFVKNKTAQIREATG